MTISFRDEEAETQPVARTPSKNVSVREEADGFLFSYLQPCPFPCPPAFFHLTVSHPFLDAGRHLEYIEKISFLEILSTFR